jgi:uncharacterized membrane protein YhfC
MASNIPLFLTYLLSIIVMIGLPIALAVFVTRKFKISWWVVLTGVLTFVVSQALRIPANLGINALLSKGVITIPDSNWAPVFYGVLAGLMAGLFEESARWVGFKFLKSKAEKFGSSLALGVGHGGMESILLCVLGTAATLATVLFYNPAAQLAKGTSSDQIQYMLVQIQQFWLNPAISGLLPGIERVIAISTQILLSILVWKAVVDRSFIWFAMAVLYHLVIDAVAVFLQGIGWGSWSIEGVLSIFLLINVFLIYRFYREEKEIEAEMEEVTEADLAVEKELEEDDADEDDEEEDDSGDDDDTDDDENGDDDEDEN